MKFIKQIRETVPRRMTSIFRAAVLVIMKICRAVWIVLFVPPLEQERIEQARLRATELSGHFQTQGGSYGK